MVAPQAHVDSGMFIQPPSGQVLAQPLAMQPDAQLLVMQPDAAPQVIMPDVVQPDGGIRRVNTVHIEAPIPP